MTKLIQKPTPDANSSVQKHLVPRHLVHKHLGTQHIGILANLSLRNKLRVSIDRGHAGLLSAGYSVYTCQIFTHLFIIKVLSV